MDDEEGGQNSAVVVVVEVFVICPNVILYVEREENIVGSKNGVSYKVLFSCCCGGMIFSIKGVGRLLLLEPALEFIVKVLCGVDFPLIKGESSSF